MTKPAAARVLTIGLMAGMLVFFAYRQRRVATSSFATQTLAADRASDGPESSVWRMVDAARTADPKGYLDCYTGEMEVLLRKNLQDMGADRFREYLSSTQSQVKGIAVSPPQMTAAGEARVPVEYVYQDRNEVQQVYVKQVGRQWKIFKIENAERIKTPVPYATPVKE
jgi:hypothetical protein